MVEKKILIRLKPLEPYFFGSERIFEIGKKSSYFIRSMQEPTQSMLFGALRYLGIEKPEASRKIDEGVIGADSYRLTEAAQTFGKIKQISSLYLMKGGDFYIKVPLDHKNEEGAGEYQALNYAHCSEIMTNNGFRYFPTEFKGKEGIVDDWMSLRDLKLYRKKDPNGLPQKIFTELEQAGNDKKKDKDAFFKKVYQKLNPDFCFAFIATVEEDFEIYNDFLYMGQGKSAFKVSHQEIFDDSLLPDFNFFKMKLRENLGSSNAPINSVFYAQSDVYYSDDIRELYKSSYFQVTEARDYRVFACNNFEGRKGSTALKLIKAGSVFFPQDAEKFKEAMENSQVQIAGFNNFVEVTKNDDLSV